MPSLADVKRAGVIEALGITTASAFNKSLSDLEWDFFSTSSGLTPKEKHSLADHKFAYYKANLPANSSVIPRSLRDAEKAYYESQGAVGSSHGDLEFDLFSRLGLELNFKALGNLELYLDARKVSGQTLVSDSFTRGKNLQPDPSFELAALGSSVWSGSGSEPVREIVNTWSRSGGKSLQVTSTSVTSHVRPISPGSSVAVIPGQTLTISGYVRAPSITRACTIEVVQFTGNNVAGTTAAVSSTVNLTPNAQRLSVTLTIPNTFVDRITPRFGLATTVAGEVFLIDDVQVELGSVATAFSAGDANELGVADTGQAWTAHTGTWGIINGEMYSSIASGDGRNFATVDTGSIDSSVSVLVKTNNDATANGLVFRYQDDQNHMWVKWQNDGMTVEKRIAGVFGPPTSGDVGKFISIKAGDTVRVDSIGSSIKVYVNNVLTHNTTDSSLINTTRVGMRLTAGGVHRVDDFIIKVPALADGDTAQIWPDLSGNNRHAVQADVTKRPLFRNASRNLLTYNQATVATDTTGFAAGYRATIARDMTIDPSGNLRVTVSNAAGDVFGNVGAGDIGSVFRIPVAPGKSYVFLASATVPVALTSRTEVTQLRIYVLRADLGYTVLSSSQSIAGSGTGTINCDVSFTVPSDALGVAVRLYNGGNVVGEHVYWDNLGLFETTVVPTWVPPVQLPNNKPVLQFDGANDSIGTLPFTHPSEATIYSVFRVSSPVTSQQRWWTHRSTNGFWGQLDSTPTISSSARNSDGTFPSTTFIGNANNIVIHSALFKNYENNVSVINGLINGAVSGSWVHEVSTPPFEIGGYVGTLHSPLELVTILYYSKKHDDATRKRIEKALGRIAGVAIAA